MKALNNFNVVDLHTKSKTKRTLPSTKVFLRKLVKAGYLDFYPGTANSRVYYITKSFNIDKIMGERNKGAYEYKHGLKFPSKMTEELAYCLGYLIADGNNGEYLIFKTQQDKRRRDHYAECLKQVFGQSPTLRQYNETSKSGKIVTNYVCNITLKNWIAFFNAIGIEPAYSADKSVPWSILRAPKESVIAFLKALIECDGKFDENRMIYNTTSKKVALQVQQLILGLGVPCYTETEKQKYKCEYKYGGKQLYHYHVIVPNDYAKQLRNIFDGELSVSAIPKTRHFVSPNSGHGIPFAEADKPNHFYTYVESIKATGRSKKVYDMTVDCAEHCYQANGITVSNSIDELGWFPNEKNSKLVKMNATEVYIALERSLLTVRSASRRRRKEGFDVLTGFFLNISSPSSERDKIMELFRKSQTSKVLLGFQKPTWKLNPTIAKKDLAEEYRIDPIAAERDYGANPPLSSNAFLTKNLIGKVMTGKPNCLSVEHKLKLHKDKSQSRYAELQKCRTAKFSSILALDAGHVSNSFALSVGHLKDSVPCIDGVVEIIPAPGASINFAKVYKDVIKPIIEIRNVKLVVADRWNSLKILSDIEEDYEISTLTYSLNYKDMRFFKDCMQFKKIILPSSKKTLDEIAEYDHSDYPNCFVNDPISHFYLQLLTVQDTGFSIIKGDQLTDDMVRASMLAVTMMMDDSYREALDSGEDEQESIAVDIKSMAVVKTLSGGGGMKNSSSSLGAIRSRS